MKDAIHDLKYYTSEHITDPKGENCFWTKEANRAQYLVPTIKTILEKPLNDESFVPWSKFLFAVGNSMYLSNSLDVPVEEWSDLAEQGRKILLKMANSESSTVIETELNAYLDRIHDRKDELMNHPKYGELIRSREGMGGG